MVDISAIYLLQPNYACSPPLPPSSSPLESSPPPVPGRDRTQLTRSPLGPRSGRSLALGGALKVRGYHASGRGYHARRSQVGRTDRCSGAHGGPQWGAHGSPDGPRRQMRRRMQRARAAGWGARPGSRTWAMPYSTVSHSALPPLRCAHANQPEPVRANFGHLPPVNNSSLMKNVPPGERYLEISVTLRHLGQTPRGAAEGR